MIIAMKKLLSVLLVAAFMVLVFPFKVSAQDTIAKTFTLEKGKIVTHNPYFAYGENVTISGTVNGDTYVAGGKVIIDGNINGDLLVAGGDVEISGNVKEDVRVMGGQVTIKGRVGKNVSAVGGNIKIDQTAVVVGSFVAAGGQIEILGQVNDNVDLAGGNIILNNKVSKDFDVAGGQIALGEKANILGKFEYWSDQKPTLASTVVIKGQTIEHAMPVKINTEKQDWNKMKEAAATARATEHVIGALSLLLVGMLLIKLSNKFMAKTAEIAKSDFWKSMGIGFLIVFVTPIAFFVLLLTIIGIPVAMMTISVYFIMLYMAKVFAIYALGVKVMPGKSPYLSYTLAVVAYAILTFIPVIGGLTSFVALLVGMGAVIVSKKASLAEYNK
jgi:cytoskeletal protein CcmA (bactofilin family)